jgi:hypothetical protein
MLAVGAHERLAPATPITRWPKAIKKQVRWHPTHLPAEDHEGFGLHRFVSDAACVPSAAQLAFRYAFFSSNFTCTRVHDCTA